LRKQSAYSWCQLFIGCLPSSVFTFLFISVTFQLEPFLFVHHYPEFISLDLEFKNHLCNCKKVLNQWTHVPSFNIEWINSHFKSTMDEGCCLEREKGQGWNIFSSFFFLFLWRNVINNFDTESVIYKIRINLCFYCID